MSLRNKMNRLVDKVTDIIPAWFTECPIGEIEVNTYQGCKYFLRFTNTNKGHMCL